MLNHQLLAVNRVSAVEHITARLARQVGHEEQNYVGFLVEYDCGRNHRVEYVLDGQASEPALGSTLMQGEATRVRD